MRQTSLGAGFARNTISNGIVSGFARANPHSLFNVGYENLAVADPAGLGRSDDGVDRLFYHAVAEHEFEFHLGEKVDDIFGAAIKLGVALLPPEALGLGHRDALQADFL